MMTKPQASWIKRKPLTRSTIYFKEPRRGDDLNHESRFFSVIAVADIASPSNRQRRFEKSNGLHFYHRHHHFSGTSSSPIFKNPISVCFNLYQFGLILRLSKPGYPSCSGMVAQPVMLGLVVLQISNIYYINDNLDKRSWTYIFGACCATTVFIPSFHNYRTGFTMLNSMHWLNHKILKQILL
ncbi:hypothetical protein ACSBR2_033471 [Camellia fascicularis]